MLGRNCWFWKSLLFPTLCIPEVVKARRLATDPNEPDRGSRSDNASAVMDFENA